jgi:hypothetical protein
MSCILNIVAPRGKLLHKAYIIKSVTDHRRCFPEAQLRARGRTYITPNHGIGLASGRRVLEFGRQIWFDVSYSIVEAREDSDTDPS